MLSYKYVIGALLFEYLAACAAQPAPVLPRRSRSSEPVEPGKEPEPRVHPDATNCMSSSFEGETLWVSEWLPGEKSILMQQLQTGYAVAVNMTTDSLQLLPECKIVQSKYIYERSDLGTYSCDVAGAAPEPDAIADRENTSIQFLRATLGEELDLYRRVAIYAGVRGSYVLVAPCATGKDCVDTFSHFSIGSFQGCDKATHLVTSVSTGAHARVAGYPRINQAPEDRGVDIMNLDELTSQGFEGAITARDGDPEACVGDSSSWTAWLGQDPGSKAIEGCNSPVLMTLARVNARECIYKVKHGSRVDPPEDPPEREKALFDSDDVTLLQGAKGSLSDRVDFGWCPNLQNGEISVSASGVVEIEQDTASQRRKRGPLKFEVYFNGKFIHLFDEERTLNTPIGFDGSQFGYFVNEQPKSRQNRVYIKVLKCGYRGTCHFRSDFTLFFANTGPG
jgi:hypothetical protein